MALFDVLQVMRRWGWLGCCLLAGCAGTPTNVGPTSPMTYGNPVVLPGTPDTKTIVRGQFPGSPGVPPTAPPNSGVGGAPQPGPYPGQPGYPPQGGFPANGNGGIPYQPPAGTLPPPNTLPAPALAPGQPPPMNAPYLQQPGTQPPGMMPAFDPFAGPPRTAPIDVYVQEARTGRFMFGVGVNSDLGVTGQIIMDERNFDLFALPTSWDDFVNGTAFRGGGQGFRLEAIPGSEVQRYMASFTEPYLFSTPVSLNVSGFLYDRNFQDWDEQRLGGRVALGYRLRPDLSTSVSFRGEEVKIFRPRVQGVPELDAVVGDNQLLSGRVSLTHDTRDVPFAPTEGHLMEFSYEQVFGDFDYPRFEVDFRKYFLIRERPDTSGRHTLSVILGAGFTGSQTPLFEHFFAGGFSTLRGFEFRGASPVDSGVIVGGDFRMLGSLEYMFPVTADDMIKAVAFCDFGTVERDIEITTENFRVAPGLGLRVFIPAMGPAPLAFDFAIPVSHADTDSKRNFNFFVGFGR